MPVDESVATSVPVSFDALVQAAQQAEIQGRRVDARDLYERALVQLPGAPSGADASSVLRWIARTYRVDAELELALDCAAAALAVAEAHGDHASIGHAMNLQAIVHWQQGKLDDAEQLYHLADENARRANEAKLSAMIAQNLGVIANIRGDLDAAMRYYESSLLSYRRLGLAADVCVALNNLGLLHTQRQRWADAGRCYDEAMCVAEALGDQKSRVQIDVNRAECLVAQGRLREAYDACERATRLSARLEDSGVVGELHKAFGIVEREMGNDARAEHHLELARQIATQRQDLLLLAEATKECAVLHQRQGRNRDTLQSLNQAHRLFAQLRARLELADVDRRMGRLEGEFLDVVRRWGESIESKDEYTQGHCERVADMACALARRTGMDEQSLFWFRIGALLHDVGKLVVPPEVLNKAGALTAEEWALMRSHPTAGVEMLAEVEFPWDVRPIVESHHERWDGRGYPHGLAGEAIPLVARILCIADVYDALTSQRSYKKAMSHGDAMDLMRLEVGKQFDPQLFTLFEGVAPAFQLPASPALEARAVATPTVPAPVEQRCELTELPLRRAFLAAAQSTLLEAAGTTPLSMLVIDIDHFKRINDTFGHLCGDAVLRVVADTLRAHARERDVVARFGGDEFLVLLPGAAAAEAAAIAETLRVAVASARVAGGHRGSVSFSISAGVAEASAHCTTAEALFARADAALLAAKRRGRDTVACASDSAASAACPPRRERFVGRGAERRAMIGLLDQATHGEPHVLTITGEAGIGKSALVRELAPDIRLRAASLLSARCSDVEAQTPFHPWAVLLDAIRVLRIVPERPWRALGRLVPGLADTESGAGQAVLFGEVVEYLRLAARARPLVLLVEDVQWVDRQSAALLEYVVGCLQHERLLICLTMRGEDLQGESLERRRRLSRNPRVRHLALAPLSSADIAECVGDALGGEVEPALAAYLEHRSGGNPFFLGQYLAMLEESGELVRGGEGWAWHPRDTHRIPAAVHDLLARRLARLSPAALRTLARASAMGRDVNVDLAVLAGVASEDALLDAIEEGVAAGVVSPIASTAESQVAFAHPLLVDLLQEQVHPRRLRRLRELLARQASGGQRARPSAPRRPASRSSRLVADGGRSQLDLGVHPTSWM